MGGLIDSERIEVAQLNVAHAHLSVSMLAASGGKAHPSALIEFVPERPEDKKPTSELTFQDWARAILPAGAMGG